MRISSRLHTAPDDAEAFADMCSKGPALNAGNAAAPSSKARTRKVHPAGKGHRNWSGGRLPPVKVEGGTVAGEEAGPPCTPCQ